MLNHLERKKRPELGLVLAGFENIESTLSSVGLRLAYVLRLHPRQMASVNAVCRACDEFEKRSLGIHGKNASNLGSDQLGSYLGLQTLIAHRDIKLTMCAATLVTGERECLQLSLATKLYLAGSSTMSTRSTWHLSARSRRIR
ncbi:hypothetical protein PZA11_000410 [Diplocarpon coronariae]